MKNETKAFKAWIQAERAGENADAERALHALFQELPEVRPRRRFAGESLTGASFSERVLREAGVAPRPAPAPLPWPLRAATAVALLLSAFALGWIPTVVSLVGQRITVGGVLDTLVQGFFHLTENVALLLSFWSYGESLYRSVMLVVMQPPVMAAALAAVLISAAALHSLRQLLALERSPRYVQA